jgi:phosphonate transport system substrate-binding protein
MIFVSSYSIFSRVFEGVVRGWVLFFAAILLFGCDNGEFSTKIDLSKREEVSFKEESDRITYAYLPQYSHRESYTRHYVLINYLGKETGLNIQQVFPDTFDQHIKMVGQKKIDISFSNPFTYVKLAHQYGAKAFARIVEVEGKDKFSGQIISRADNSSILNISDCRNKRWLAVDSASAGGFLFPLALFAAHGIDITDFKEVAFTPGPGGKQEKVILSVYNGKYDFGTIREGSLSVLSNKIDIDKIRIVSTTDSYPGWVYSARKNLDKITVEKIKQALVKLDVANIEHGKILEAAHFIKVIPSDDSDFDSVRQLADRVGMTLDE